VPVKRLANGGVEIEVAGLGKAHIAAQPGLSFAAATTLLPGVAQAWSPQNPLQFVDDSAKPHVSNLGGSGAYRYSQQNLVDQGGPNVVHGIFYLHVRHAGQG